MKSVVQRIGRELAVTVTFSAVVAATFTALGFVGSFLAQFAYDRTVLLLDERACLAIFVPTFLAAWAWAAARRLILRSRARTIAVTAGLGLAVALANRFILFADAEAPFCNEHGCVVGFFAKANALLETVTHGAWSTSFALIDQELASGGSLLWFSVYGVAIAVGSALLMQKKARAFAM